MGLSCLQEIRGARPPDYFSREVIDAERQQRIVAARGGKWHSHPSCHLEDWVQVVHDCVNTEGKTPLLMADNQSTYVDLMSRVSSLPGVVERPFPVHTTITTIIQIMLYVPL